MKGIFSIEWMAQSSQSTSPEFVSGPAQTAEPTTCGTNSESLPGFYCRRPQTGAGDRSSGLGAFNPSSLHQTSHTAPETEADFSSGTEEETSGYESEEGHSHSPAVPVNTVSTTPPSPPSGRRPRTAFTAEQINSLEQAFKRNAYLGTQDKAELCKKLHLSDKQIRNWFQNRRMKLKRTVQDALAHVCQANIASHFMHYPELSYRSSPYQRYPSSAQDSSVSAAPYGPHRGLQDSSVSAAPYGPHRGLQDSSVSAAPYGPHRGLQYSSPLTPLSRDSLYQYNSVPTVMLPSTAPLMSSYPSYPQYY